MPTVVLWYAGLAVFFIVCGVGFTFMAKVSGYDLAKAMDQGSSDKSVAYEMLNLGIMFGVGCLCVTGAAGTILGGCLGVRRYLKESDKADAESG